MKITKAVIPAAGLGTRVLPATKAVPKEMLTIVDKPSLQYIVEELVASGIKDILIVTGRNKTAIEDHFDYSYEIEDTLEKEGKEALLNQISHLSKVANVFFVRQNKPLGLGHAILKAKPFVGNEPFVVCLGDDIVDNDGYPVAKQLADNYDKYGASIVGCQVVPHSEVSRYGIVSPAEQLDDNTYRLDNFVEKPSVDESPSDIACLGRYLLTSKIFAYLERGHKGAGGEIQLTDSIYDMMVDGEKVVAYTFAGKRYDIGTKLGLIKANIEYGLRHPETAAGLKEYLERELQIK